MSFLSWLRSWFTEPDPKIAQVQALTVKACSFLPLATSVAAVMAVNPQVAGVALIAQQICAIVTRTPPVSRPMILASNTDGSPVLTWQAGAITIQGQFVNK